MFYIDAVKVYQNSVESNFLDIKNILNFVQNSNNSTYKLFITIHNINKLKSTYLLLCRQICTPTVHHQIIKYFEMKTHAKAIYIYKKHQ